MAPQFRPPVCLSVSQLCRRPCWWITHSGEPIGTVNLREGEDVDLDGFDR